MERDIGMESLCEEMNICYLKEKRELGNDLKVGVKMNKEN